MFRVWGLRFWGFWGLEFRLCGFRGLVFTVWGFRVCGLGWVQVTVTELGVILGYFARTLVRTSIVSLEKDG